VIVAGFKWRWKGSIKLADKRDRGWLAYHNQIVCVLDSIKVIGKDGA